MSHFSGVKLSCVQFLFHAFTVFSDAWPGRPMPLKGGAAPFGMRSSPSRMSTLYLEQLCVSVELKEPEPFQAMKRRPGSSRGVRLLRDALH